LDPNWQDDVIVSYFKGKMTDFQSVDLFNYSNEHLIPEVFSDVFRYFKP